MSWNSEDQEMNRIYQESLHPKGYSEDSKFGKYQKTTKKEQDISNKFKQDMRKNVNRHSINGRVNNYNVDAMKSTFKLLMGVGILIIILVFVLIPFIFYAR